MQLEPEFKFNLNQKILPGMVAAGKFNANSTFLVAGLTGGKVLVTNLWSSVGSSSDNYNLLNINQAILSLTTGRFHQTDENDLLFVGTGSTLLVYDVENNKDKFFKEIADGVACCVVGSLGVFKENVVVVGGSCSLAVFDHTGQEVMWSVTGDNVTSLAIVDIQNRGTKDLIVGSEDFEIRIFREDDIVNEITETEIVTNLCAMGGSLFGYGLANGTVGVYDRLNRLWRIKSKSFPTVIMAFDMNCNGEVELVTGWSNGKIDVRKFDTGEVLFKDHLKSAVAGIVVVTHQQYQCELLLVCSNEGEVRIYKQISGISESKFVANQEQIYDLTLKKQTLLMEMKNFEDFTNNRTQTSSAEAAIPGDTKIDVAMKINNTNNGGVDLCFSTNHNDIIIRCVMIFAEGIFDGECHVAHPSTNKLSSSLIMTINPPNDIQVDLHMKVIVGYKTGSQFTVFELIRSLPRFSMYSLISNEEPFKKPSGYAQFVVQERLPRFVLWVNQNFLIGNEIPSPPKDQQELIVRFLGLRKTAPVEINVNAKSNQVTIFADNIDLACTIVQSLCEYLNVTDLQSVCSFPKEFEILNEIISKIDGIQTSRQRMTNDIADNSNVIKNFIVRAEDCRIMQDMVGMKRYYSELLHLNTDLINRYKVRSTNHQELLNLLKFVNQFIQKGGNLRAGKYRTQTVALCRQAVKNNQLNQLEKLIRTGSE